MTTVKWTITIACWSFIGNWAFAQESKSPQTPQTPNFMLAVQAAAAPKSPDTGADEKKKDAVTSAPPIDFAQAPSLRSESPVALNNAHMIGDFSGGSRLINVQVPTLNKTVIVKVDIEKVKTFSTIFTRGTTLVETRVPIVSRGGFNIAENESILPQDRVFFTYNYFNNLQGPSQGRDQPHVIPQQFVVPVVTVAPNPSVVSPGVKVQNFASNYPPVTSQTFTGQVFVPGVTPPRFDVSREVVGFEKSFFDGAWSFGMRAPVFQANGPDAFAEQDVGDMTFVLKNAAWRNAATGDAVSLGLAVTAPTGPRVETTEGNIHPTILQPFAGYQFIKSDFVLFGFTSVAVPTDDRDVTLLFNDVGLGYQLMKRAGVVSSIMPALEAHLTTPLNHRRDTDVIQGTDLLALTGGLHVGLGNRSLFTIAVVLPVTGPRPYDVEAVSQLQFGF